MGLTLLDALCGNVIRHHLSTSEPKASAINRHRSMDHAKGWIRDGKPVLMSDCLLHATSTQA